jgi:hypothetical protein
VLGVEPGVAAPAMQPPSAARRSPRTACRRCRSSARRRRRVRGPRRWRRASACFASAPAGSAARLQPLAQSREAGLVLGVGALSLPHVAEDRLADVAPRRLAAGAQAQDSRDKASELKGWRAGVARTTPSRCAIQCTWRKVQARFGSISAGPLWPQCLSSAPKTIGR